MGEKPTYEELEQRVKELENEAFERKRAEEALRESEEQYRTLFENASEAIYVAQDGMIKFHNPKTEELYGYSKEELNSRPFTHFIHEEDKEMVLDRHKRRVKGEKPRTNYPFRIINKHGDARWVEINVAEISWDNRPATLCFLTDIDERIQAEKALKTSGEKYRTIIENMVDVYYEVDLAGNMTYFNDSLCHMTGYTRDELTGMNNREYMDEETAKRVYQVFTEVYDSGKPVKGFDYEILVPKYGSKKDVESSVNVIRDAEGQPTGFRGVLRDVTERKRAEQLLRESKDNLDKAQNLARIGSWSRDLKSGQGQWSDEMYRTLGLTPGEPENPSHELFLSRVHPDDRERTASLLEEVTQGRSSYDLEFRTVPINGSERIIHVRAQVECDEKGLPVRRFGINQDITERKQSEEALRESEEKYRTILESIEESYFEVDIAGKFTFFNDSLSKSLGYSNDELAGMNNRDYMPPESSKKIYDLFNQIYNTGNPIKKVVYEIIRKDGSHGFHELSASLKKDQTGRPIGFRGIAHDITDLKKAQDALRESEEKYRTILESIEDGYYELDIAGDITFCNDSMCRILGYPKDELMGMNNREYMDQETAKNVYQSVNRVYTTGKVEKGLQYELTRKDGAKIYVEASVSLMKDEENQPIGFRGILRDITERKRAEQEKRRLEAKLQQAQKMEAIGTLAGGVAHDLNNILGGLVSYPELLLMQIPHGNPLRKPIQTIQKSGEKAAAVVEDLLTLARRGVVVTDVVDLNDVIAEYLKSPEHEKLQLYHPGVHIETRLEKDVLKILGSSTHLSKTVMNLVSNAAEAMPEGGTLTVSTENRHIDRPIRGYDNVKEGDYVVFTISDTGTGISPDDIEKIFEPFYTKKKMGRSGTGLGMAVVWGTVKDHNGYIDVQSTEGKGTIFTLYFPVTRKEVMERITAGSIEDYLGKGESILVVDDVEEQRELASGMLRKLGYSVSTVSSGEKAVEYLKNSKTDLIVLDMIMDPGIDGFETYKRILEMYPGQKAIIASGFSETERIKEAQRLGAGAYIKKPFLLEKLGIAIKEELEK